MTKIRLARTGSIHQPHYRIVVTDSRNPRDGRFIEILGAYHPLQGGEVSLKPERAAYWISVGAQPSNTVIGLLTKAGVKHTYSVRRKPERKAAVAEKPVDEVASAETVEAGDEMIAEQPLSDEAAEAGSETPEVSSEQTAEETQA